MKHTVDRSTGSIKPVKEHRGPKDPRGEGVAEPFQKSAAVTAWFRSSVREEVPNFLDTGLDQGCQCGQ